MKLKTRDEKGKPICYICEKPVDKAGAACSRECHIHLLVAVAQVTGPVIVEDSILTARESPWYGDTDGLDTPPA